MEEGLIFLLILFGIGCAILEIVAMWRIFEKCGYSGPLSLLLLLPIVNLVILLVVAFGDTSRPRYQQYQPPPAPTPPPAGHQA